VFRFVLMLMDAQGTGSSIEPDEHRSLDALLSALLARARSAGFARMPELSLAIQSARTAERRRDIIFSHSSIGDAAAMKQTADELERLDATFVGLCVEHVLETYPGARLETSM
jgi:hypothetical protein